MNLINWIGLFVIFGVATLIGGFLLANIILWIRRKYGEDE